MKSIFSDYLKQSRIRVVEGVSVSEPKTKHASALVKKLGLPAKSLLVVEKIDPVFAKASRNLEGLRVRLAKDLNGYDVLLSDQLVFTKAGLAVLLKRLEGEGAAALSAN